MERLTSIVNADALPVGILALVVVETLTLVWWQRRRERAAPRSTRVLQILTFMGAGAALIAAMLFHRRGVPAPGLFALAMLAALVLHVWHLSVLLRR